MLLRISTTYSMLSLLFVFRLQMLFEDFLPCDTTDACDWIGQSDFKKCAKSANQPINHPINETNTTKYINQTKSNQTIVQVSLVICNNVEKNGFSSLENFKPVPKELN